MTDSESNRETKEPRPAWLNWLQIFAVAAVLAFVLNAFLIADAHVPTGSMVTTIILGDRIIGSHPSYRFGDPACDDIVIFRVPDEPETLYVKRIIDLPDDKVTIRGGHVYLDDSETPLKESYIKEPMKPAALQEFQVSEDAYFCIGDSRNGSVSAHYQKGHYVHRDKIIAKVLFRYWPGIKVLK